LPAGVTYTTIATQTLGSSQSSISFTSISQSYTDLIIVSSLRGSTSNDFRARWGNGSYDTGTNYSNTTMYARSTSNDYGSSRDSNSNYARLSSQTYVIPEAAATFGTNITHIMNYSKTTTFKSGLSRSSGIGAAAYAGTETMVFLWRSTAAINQIQFYAGASSGNFESGTTITLYGILAA